MRNKQTKIIATISDKKASEDFLRNLFQSGMDAIRLNSAHMAVEAIGPTIKMIRNVSPKIPVMIDTKGPEVRTCGMPGPLEVEAGKEILLTSQEIGEGEAAFQVNYGKFIQEVGSQGLGTEILLDDGDVSFTVVETSRTFLRLRVNNSGTIQNKKSINVPKIHLQLPAVTEKDREFIVEACRLGVDFIAHSFVRNRQDLEEVQKIIDENNGSCQIISKIENREGVQNIEDILDLSYGIMIARGDLGIELPAAEVPLVQKQLIKACIRRSKPVITATQMLHSMIENPRPTRAEVSDVANAILDGTDAVMLSGETAYGEYPIESVEMMSSIAKQVEMPDQKTTKSKILKPLNPIRFQLIKNAIEGAQVLGAKAILVHTSSGRSARLLAAYRSCAPIKALCTNEEAMRQLALSRGVEAFTMEWASTIDELVARSCVTLLKESELKNDDLIVMVADVPGKAQCSNFLEIGTLAQLASNHTD